MLEGFKMNCYPLNRTIRVSIRLPKDYNQTGRYYPAIYFLDGQNLYDEKEAYNGKIVELESVIDKLEKDGKDAIYIGIAGASNIEKRNMEYNTTLLADFIFNSIHPFLKTRYRLNNYTYSCGWEKAVLNVLALNQKEGFKGAILLFPKGDYNSFQNLVLQKDNLYYILDKTNNELTLQLKELLPTSEIQWEDEEKELPTNQQLYEALSYLIL